MKASVLIVEDDEVLQRALRDRIRHWGHAVATASSGEEALTQIPLVKPDLVIMDIRMGRMNGLETLRAIRKIDPKLLTKYDGIRKKRAGIGLVLVEDGTCQGCHIQLPPQLYNELQRGNTFECCPSCNRILFWRPLAERTTEDQAGIQP
jgi:CheY-like chemotaxis protein